MGTRNLRHEPGVENMSITVWDDRYKTGHELVDKQHQELFRMVNKLHDAIMANKGNEALAPTLQELAKYTIAHFRAEEGLMASTQYPALAVHKGKYDDLTREVQQLMERFREGKLVLSMTLSSFLAKWLKNHIQGDDIAMIKYVKAHSAVKAATVGH
jgi:hemerythrin